MLLIGVDYHPRFQQIAFFEEETGECGERQLCHSDGETERFSSCEPLQATVNHMGKGGLVELVAESF